MPSILTILCFLGLFFAACELPTALKNHESSKPNISIETKDSFPTEKRISAVDLGIQLQASNENYQSLINRIVIEKLALKQAFDAGSIDLDSVRNYFTNTLVNKIIPYWYGMPWDFSGYSAIPGQGTVGCSYFVSTTLEHIGLKVNRYKLAQQAPLGEARTLSLGDSIIEMQLGDFQNDNLKEGLYFVGLSASHVGYLLKKQGIWFFIQSNYDSPQEVLIERLDSSAVFNSYPQFYVVPLTHSDAFLVAWLKGTTINIQQ